MVDANRDTRTLMLKAKPNSGGAHPAVRKGSSNSRDPAFCLKSRLTLIQELCRTSPDYTEAQKAELIHLLVLRPVHRTSQFDTTNGTVTSGPIDVENSVGYFENSLQIIKNARRHVGVTHENQTLSEKEFFRAKSWLQETFEEKFMRNPKMRAEIRQYGYDPGLFNRKQKKAFHECRRGAFKAWQKDLFGNTPLFNAFLQEGMFDFNDIRQFLDVLLSKDTTPKISDGEHLADNLAVKRLEAKQARLNLKRALGYDKRLKKDRTREQQMLVDRLDELEDICIEKNQAYGHGMGTTKPITQHDAILHRMSCLRMGQLPSDEPADLSSGGEHPTDAAPKRKRTVTPAHEHERADREKPLPVTRAERIQAVNLEEHLLAAIGLGWPTWCNQNADRAECGGQISGHDKHEFDVHRLKYGARVDMWRGGCEDDIGNKEWSHEYLRHMPRFEKCFHQGGSSDRARGDKMESAIGTAYAAATAQQFLPVGSKLLWKHEDSQEAWIRAWWAFQALGFGPAVVANDMK